MVDLNKRQKQDLGNAIKDAGFEHSDFVFLQQPAKRAEGIDYISLTNKETSDEYRFAEHPQGYIVLITEPGTAKKKDRIFPDWYFLVKNFEEWVKEVKSEAEAVDPWAEDARSNFGPGQYFTPTDLPKIDRAVDASIEELKRIALSNGKK